MIALVQGRGLGLVCGLGLVLGLGLGLVRGLGLDQGVGLFGLGILKNDTYLFY